MSNPNDPFPVPPEGAPHSGQAPYAGQPPHVAPPYQPPYGGPPPQQPYGGPPQPPYGPPPAGNTKVLIWVIAGLGLVIIVGAILILTGAFEGRRSGSGSSGPSYNTASSNYASPSSDYGAYSGNNSSANSTSTYSSNSSYSPAPSYSSNSVGSYDSSERNRQLQSCRIVMSREARADVNITALCNCAVDHKMRTGSSERAAVEACAYAPGVVNRK